MEPVEPCPKIAGVSTVSAGTELSLEDRSILWGMVQKVGDHISSAEKELLFTVLLEYKDVFSLQEREMGRTSLTRHRIHTGDSPPIHCPSNRIPQARKEEVRKLLEDMLGKGVIQPSDSPWSSPIVLARKKDGSVRFCVDYRKVNSVTRKDAYPLPRIDDTLDTLAGSKLFSTLDLKTGYWQVEMADEDRAKTAFCTSEGLYEFKVLPFGLCNAPATFQRLMDRVLHGLKWHSCLVYIDDIVVVGATFKDHVHNLVCVLKRLQEAGLKLKPSKCNLLRKEVTYLGHVISEEGTSTDPAKTDVIRKWPIPSCKRELLQFLGLANYYRRFVNGFATICKPLQRLTEKNFPFSWSPSCQHAFDELRNRLVTAPILVYPDYTKPFI